MVKSRGIAFKLILSFSLSAAIIFTIIFSFSYRFSRKMIEKNVEDNARILALSNVYKIQSNLTFVQRVPENLAYFFEQGSYHREELLHLLRMVVENNLEIYGSTIAFEPYAINRKSLYYAPYYYKRNGKVAFSYLGSESYRYFSMDWYQIPKELNRPDWSEPYYDEGGGNILMATYSVPIYKKIGGKRSFTGIITADISLGWLQDIVSSIKILQTGYGFLISKNGTIITHPSKELIMNETLFGVAEARGDAHLREIARKMIRGESGFIPFKSITSEKQCWMYYTPIPSSGWSLAVLFPQDELLSDITRLNRIVIYLGMVGILLLSVVVVFIARSITRPLRQMAKVTQEIGKGNLDIELPMVKSGDEVGKLSDAIHYMRTSLREYIKQLTETTAAKERIESELKIAHDIQTNILPKVFPPFPNQRDFDIYAFMEPAREVGGDFYDFFLIDENHLCFVIGDASGKGIPAALFMAVTKTLLKATAAVGLSPGDILTNVNKELSQGNDACMFTTVFMGILHTKTGEIFYANGGHNPPLVLRKDREIQFLEGGRGLVVGAMENSNYETERFILRPGESLLMYTDGVTEAMNQQGEAFSEGRLKNEIALSYGESIQDMIGRVMKKIIAFSYGTPQSDDITMMMIQFRGKKG